MGRDLCNRVDCGSEHAGSHSWRLTRGHIGRREHFQRYLLYFVSTFLRTLRHLRSRRICSPWWLLAPIQGHGAIARIFGTNVAHRIAAVYPLLLCCRRDVAFRPTRYLGCMAGPPGSARNSELYRTAGSFHSVWKYREAPRCSPPDYRLDDDRRRNRRSCTPRISNDCTPPHF